ncbi:short-chain dehydrogenase/reductase-like protein [Xylariomycetidae sp. FL2044]|nr:short-chain dehydrogenase/reductase-like protein [Xylariomycetidae sp. FL2044]
MDNFKATLAVAMNPEYIKAWKNQWMRLPVPAGDFSAKVVIVTGANCGIGLECARHFVRLGAKKVILACRDNAKAETAKRDIEATEQKFGVVETWNVDLSSFQSVVRFCDDAKALDRLDVVVENASLLSLRYETFEAYERQCTVNILSTWLMAFLLIPVLRRTAETYYREESVGKPHLCVVGSNGHYITRFQQRKEISILDAFKGDGDMYNRYFNTKLIALFIAREVSGRLKGKDREPHVILNVVSPGFCASELNRENPWPWYVAAVMKMADKMIGRSAEVGSRNYIWAACAGPESHGAYIEHCSLGTPSSLLNGEDGEQLQQKIYRDLTGVLVTISPGISLRAFDSEPLGQVNT